jgi:hypothetical protein
VTSSGLVAVEAEAGGDDGDGEEVGVFVPADGGHDGGAGEDAAECPQVDASGSGGSAAAFLGGGGQRASDDGGQPAANMYGQGDREDGSSVGDRKPKDFTGQHRDHPDYTGPSVDDADRPCRIAMACWRVMMLQVMRRGSR